MERQTGRLFKHILNHVIHLYTHVAAIHPSQAFPKARAQPARVIPWLHRTGRLGPPGSSITINSAVRELTLRGSTRGWAARAVRPTPARSGSPAIAGLTIGAVLPA
jgi:hypothetical protein